MFKKLFSWLLARPLNRYTAKPADKGFTLLELLIVIAILATLATILVLVLNPAETLAKSRDTQRMSDLQTIKAAIALYATTAATPDLDADIVNHCLTGTPNIDAAISYSYEGTDSVCVADVAEGTDVTTGSTFDSAAGDFCRVVSSGATLTDGTGWVPVKLSSIVGGSPISNLPLDPSNDNPTATPDNTKRVYRYACQNSSDTAGDPSYVFELNAILESEEFKTTASMMSKDGGDNTNYLEIGTSLRLLGTGTNY